MVSQQLEPAWSLMVCIDFLSGRHQAAPALAQPHHHGRTRDLGLGVVTGQLSLQSCPLSVSLSVLVGLLTGPVVLAEAGHD